MIGHSLSFCVTDIANGTVDISDVEKIITGTKFESWEDWDTAINAYCVRNWRGYSKKARKIVETLLSSDRIEQPRLFGENPSENINVADFNERWSKGA